MRICFIGDSFVNGTGDDDCLGWTGRVCSAARKAGHDLTFYNLGIRRDTSADIAARWRREAEARLPAEHDCRLVFSFGANDCTPGNEADGRRVARERTLAHARDILGTARAWLPTLMVGPLPVCDDPATNERIARLSKDMGRLCATLHVPYLEVFPLALSSPLWTLETRKGDGAHPNVGGYALIAGAVERWDAWRHWIDTERH